VPLVFVALASLLLVDSLWTAPRESLFGVVVMALGGVAYRVLRGRT
jgi:hypothetical protein